tara:strand:- start:381 stop:1085 length:705 start_codon:yes stop_codon:yes gene_type:complete
MSFDTNKTWFYQFSGRDLQLYQYVQSANTDTLAGFRIKLPSDYYANQLIYPNEDITDGLRIEYTSLDEPFIAEALEDMQVFIDGTGIAFVDGGGSPDTITDTGTGFVTAGFASTDKIRVIGSASNDGDYQLTNAAAGTLTMATALLTAETASESVTIYQIPKEDSSPDETSHVNLNKMLSLACVDYVKAMLSDLTGDIQKKEYYMREFWKKIGDNDSNKRKIVMSFPIGTYAVR